MGRNDYHYIHEPCIYGWKKGAAHNWFGDRKQHTFFEQETKPLEKMTKEELLVFAKSALEARPNTSVAEFDKPSRSLEHPTMKPVELCGYYISNSSREEDIVLDLFLGSGSTMVAAHQMGRICYGTELDPQYCDVIIDRMRKLDPSLTIKLNGKII
jgi:site-specific DNA-methyltransferase (adenine-specific)